MINPDDLKDVGLRLQPGPSAEDMKNLVDLYQQREKFHRLRGQLHMEKQELIMKVNIAYDYSQFWQDMREFKRHREVEDHIKSIEREIRDNENEINTAMNQTNMVNDEFTSILKKIGVARVQDLL